MVHLYQSMVQPILLYGSEMWGHNKIACQIVDKLFFWFVRLILKVKSNTSNIIILDRIRLTFFTKIKLSYPHFEALKSKQKFIYLFNTDKSRLLTWLGQFILEAFEIRNAKLSEINTNSSN